MFKFCTGPMKNRGVWLLCMLAAANLLFTLLTELLFHAPFFSLFLYFSNTAFIALHGRCFARVPICFVTLWGLICWNCSHMFVSAHACGGAHAIICFIIREKDNLILYVRCRGRDLCLATGLGMLGGAT